MEIFEAITDPAELSRLLDLLFEAEVKFTRTYGPKSWQATEMYELSYEMPIFDYEGNADELRVIFEDQRSFNRTDPRYYSAPTAMDRR